MLPDGSTGYNSIDLEALGGMVVDDFDGDGALDWLIADGERAPRYFRGLGDGTFQQRDLDSVGLPREGLYLHGMAAADWDGDGDPDLLFADRGADRAFRNDGGVFTDITDEMGFADTDRRTLSFSFADFDQDEDLDIYATRYGDGVVGESFENEAHKDSLYVAAEDGGFRDHHEWVHEPSDDGYGFNAVWFDANGDRWQDLYVVNDLGTEPENGPTNWFRRNTGTGDPHLWEFEVTPNATLDEGMMSMGVGVGDLDGDGDADVHVSNAGQTFLGRNDGEDGFADLSVLLPPRDAALGDISWGTLFYDHDNDGRDELFVGYGWMPSKEIGRGPAQTSNQVEQFDRLFADDGEGGFVDLAPGLGIDDPAPTRSVIVADVDRNGFLDLLTWRIGVGPRLWLAQCNSHAWLSVALEQEGSRNRDAIGARVEAWSGDRLVSWADVRLGGTGTQTTQPPVAHLGVGTLDEVDVAVHWPSGGLVTVNANVSTRRSVRISRP